MDARGPQHLRKTTNVVLDALLAAVEAAAAGQPIPLSLLESTVANLKVSTTFDGFYRRSYQELMPVMDAEKRESRRSDCFGRLMVHPLGALFQDGTLDRELMPNIFSFLHMVLGDEMDSYATRCREIVDSLRADRGDAFTWDDFYDDREAKLIHWKVLVTVAGSFKRYELRKDWFLKLMQNRPTSISLASNAFITREHAPTDEPIVFGEHEFCAFFHALFDPMAQMGRRDEEEFQKEFGADPHHLIGGFLVNLSMCTV